MNVHRYAAHVIMSGRRHRDRLFRRVDAGGHAACINRGEFFGEMRAERVGGVEQHAMAGGNFREHAARHDIARRQFSQRMPSRHETFAPVVDQRRAFPAQRFCRQRRRIATDHDRGRVKLHEFRIGDDSAGTRGDRKSKSAGLGRICRHRIEMPDAAGRQHHRARRNRHRFCYGVAGLAQLQTSDRAVLGQKRFRGKTFDHPDRRRLAHGVDQRCDDSLAGHVTADMHDASGGMRGLLCHRELAFEVAIEWHAVTEQVVDARAGFACEAQRYRCIDQAGTDGDRIGRVRLRAVAFGDRGRDAALRPRRRGALAQRRRGNHGDRTRRQLQRAEQAGETAADDDDIVGVAGEVMISI